MYHPLNTILYGPPGTGKTYATLERCVRICDGEDGELSPERIRQRFDELVEAKRVEFITFHQSYGYEEFVEGLRPRTGEGGGLRLEVRDGVLKEIAKRARDAPDLTEVERDGADPAADGKRRFFKASLFNEELFDECMRDGCMRFTALDFGEDYSWQDFRDSRFDDYDAVLALVAERYSGGRKRWWDTKSFAVLRAYMRPGSIVVVPRLGAWRLADWRQGPKRHVGAAGSFEEYIAVGEVIGEYDYDGSHVWPHSRAVRWLWSDPHNARRVNRFQDKGFAPFRLHEFRPKRPQVLLDYLNKPKEAPSPRQLHVLVIDEINRANVAKVLGELITLLEDDKREGAANELAVTLPHSGDRFTLPSNLYVLGTMNTADRSIALLDTALRRRFAFEELAADPSLPLLKDVAERTGVDVTAVLRAINERLEWLVDRDHLIGHAWFLGASSRRGLDEIMRRKVIPLIAEYFYDDWEKVRAVLGGTDAFVRGDRLQPPPGIDSEGETRYRWTVPSLFPHDAYEQLVAGCTAVKGAAATDDADVKPADADFGPGESGPDSPPEDAGPDP